MASIREQLAKTGPYTTMPPAPEWLNAEGREEWHRCGQKLIELQLLNPMNLSVFQERCKIWGECVALWKAGKDVKSAVKNRLDKLSRMMRILNVYYNIRTESETPSGDVRPDHRGGFRYERWNRNPKAKPRRSPTGIGGSRPSQRSSSAAVGRFGGKDSRGVGP